MSVTLDVKTLWLGQDMVTVRFILLLILGLFRLLLDNYVSVIVSDTTFLEDRTSSLLVAIWHLQ